MKIAGIETIRVANDEFVTAREVIRHLSALWSARGPRR